MSRLAFAAVALALVAAAPTPTFAADKDAKQKTINATLTSNKDSYPVDPTQSGAAFVKSMKDKNANPQAASKVDLILHINNGTDKPLTFNYGGDETTIEFTLKGPGALTVVPMKAMTMEYRGGTPTTIAPGKSFDIPLNSLAAGMRGISQYSFFTEPGDYTLTATFHYNVGETSHTLTSDELKLKITEAKK